MFNVIFNSIVVPASILLPLLAGFLNWKRLNSAGRTLIWYLLTTALVNTISTIAARYFHLNNMPLVHLYTIAEIIFFSLFFQKALALNTSRLALYTGIAFTILSVINAVFFQSIYLYNSYTRSIEAIICILFTLWYFAKISATMDYREIIRLPEFYFSIGTFLYFAGAFILFIFSNFIGGISSKADFIAIWNIHAILVLLEYLIFTIGFYLCRE